jgi:hypothetical protein
VQLGWGLMSIPSTHGSDSKNSLPWGQRQSLLISPNCRQTDPEKFIVFGNARVMDLLFLPHALSSVKSIPFLLRLLPH